MIWHYLHNMLYAISKGFCNCMCLSMNALPAHICLFVEHICTKSQHWRGEHRLTRASLNIANLLHNCGSKFVVYGHSAICAMQRSAERQSTTPSSQKEGRSVGPLLNAESGQLGSPVYRTPSSQTKGKRIFTKGKDIMCFVQLQLQGILCMENDKVSPFLAFMTGQSHTNHLCVRT